MFYHSSHNFPKKNVFFEYMFMLSTHFLNYIETEHEVACCCCFKYFKLEYRKKKLTLVIIPASSTVFVCAYYSMA